MFPLPLVARRPDVVPGSVSYTTPGTFQFEVPDYNTLTVVVRGGGAQGYQGSPINGNASSFNGNVIASGGLTSANTFAGGLGGTASGGDQNYTGGNGGGGVPNYGGVGGDAANDGGSGGNGFGLPGQAPGGGGAGSVIGGYGRGGGGGGGCAVKTYVTGLDVGSLVEVVVANSAGATCIGARGQVDISWN